MIYKNLNDETLVMLTLSGEQEAYEVLVNRYQKAVIAAARVITRNDFLAEDAAQDAFVSAWMKLDTLTEPEKYKAWVCRIARNCAVNMVKRFRGYLSLDAAENYISDGEPTLSELVDASADSTEVNRSVDRLPQKVKEVIRLYYFEGLSVVEIAERMSITEGTVKSQLFDGRKRIRKELCAMNEKWNDTLVQKVMKKVEELKLWKFKANKEGFKTVYDDVLKDIEDLPESEKKYHALADVLMRGWWWLPGDKNDALFAKMKEAAETGHNDEVMQFIMKRERRTISYNDHKSRIEFIRDKQIPRVEGAGLPSTLASLYYWLGYHYMMNGQTEEGIEANRKVLSIVSPKNAFYALALNNEECMARVLGDLKGKHENRYAFGWDGIELKYIDGAPRIWNAENNGGEGWMQSLNRDIVYVLTSASVCDGIFYDDKLRVGESIEGSENGMSLTFESDNETVETPAGVFEGCECWITRQLDKYDGRNVFKTYYKRGVGIVKFTVTNSSITDALLLKSYTVRGGEGRLPLAVGNKWSYTSDRDPDCIIVEKDIKVIYADEDGATVAQKEYVERIKYDESSWSDMISAIRCEYYDDKDNIADVEKYAARAEALAKTNVEKAHTKAAVSVARRIMATDSKFNPSYKAKGYWNFFQRDFVMPKDGKYNTERVQRWSFEWKNYDYGADVLLCNHIYGILNDAGKYLWSDEWQAGYENEIKYALYGEREITSRMKCIGGKTVTTEAGTFENCLLIEFDIKGMSEGHRYRGGRKDFYFADGIGLVRVINYLEEGALIATYDLTSYEGTGEGYMPISDGLVRKYEGVGFTDGYYGASEYTYAEDENGDIVIFADLTGIRNKPMPITRYDFIQGELIEDELWDANDRPASRIRNGVNDLNVFMHYFGRYDRSRGDARRAATKGEYKLNLLRNFIEDGVLPRAWTALYWRQHFYEACYLFGCKTPKDKEKGYEYLRLALEHYNDWNDIPDGEVLEFAFNDYIFGGVKFIKGKNKLLLPDGREETVYDPYMFRFKSSMMYHGMTAPKGWEWFNSVRSEELFQEYVSKAKELMAKE